MTKTLTKVIYKPDSQSTDEYMIIVNPEEYKKWKAGDTSIPLSEVVDSFSVWQSTQGSQGLLGTPSNQQLDNIFGTHKDIDVVTFILKNGKDQSGELAANAGGPLNASRGNLDHKGSKNYTGI